MIAALRRTRCSKCHCGPLIIMAVLFAVLAAPSHAALIEHPDGPSLLFNVNPAGTLYGLGACGSDADTGHRLQYTVKAVPNDLTGMNCTASPARIFDDTGTSTEEVALLDMGIPIAGYPVVQSPAPDQVIGGIVDLEVQVYQAEDDSHVGGKVKVLFEYSLNSTTGLNGDWFACIPAESTINPVSIDDDGMATMKWDAEPRESLQEGVWIRARTYRTSVAGSPLIRHSGLYSAGNVGALWINRVNVNNIFTPPYVTKVTLLPFMSGNNRQPGGRIILVTDRECSSVFATINGQTHSFSNPSGDNITWVAEVSGALSSLSISNLQARDYYNESNVGDEIISSTSWSPSLRTVTTASAVPKYEWILRGFPVILSPKGKMRQLSEIASDAAPESPSDVPVYGLTGIHGSGGGQEYVLIDGDLADGTGYWIRPEKSARMSVTGFRVDEVDADKLFYDGGEEPVNGFASYSFEYPLVRGWNFVTLPYEFGVSQLDMRIRKNNSLHTWQEAHTLEQADPIYWHWNGVEWEETTTLQPWHAVAVRAWESCSLVIPPVKSTGRSSAPLRGPMARSPGDWRIQMEVIGPGGLADRRNFIGLIDNERGLRHTAPPQTFADHYVSMYFPHQDGGYGRDSGDTNNRSERYAYDIRPYRIDGQYRWNMVVETSLPDTALSISWHGLQSVQGLTRMSLTRFDEQGRVMSKTDMRSDAYLAFTSSSGRMEAGHHVSRNYFEIALETGVDLYPPAFAGLMSVSPTANAGEVYLQWNSAYDFENSNPITYRIYVGSGPEGASVASMFDFENPAKETMNLYAAVSGLKPGSTRCFVVRAVDAAGNEDANVRAMSIEVPLVADREPPYIVSCSPSDGARDICLLSRVEMEFSELLRFADVNDTNVRLTEGGRSVLADVAFFPFDRNRVILKPQNPLNPDTLYRVTVSGLRDMAGNVMETESWSFYTEASRYVSGGLLLTGQAQGGDMVFVRSLDAPEQVDFAPIDNDGSFVLHFIRNVRVGEGLEIWLDNNDRSHALKGDADGVRAADALEIRPHVHRLTGAEADMRQIHFNLVRTDYNRGLNVLALPHKPSGIMYGRDLIRHTGSPVLIHFNPEIQGFSVLTGNEGLGYEVHGDEGFIIDLPASTSVIWGNACDAGDPGDDLSTRYQPGIRPVPVYQGLNIVPVSAAIDAEKLCKAYDAAMLIWYNSANTRFEGFVRGYTSGLRCKPGFGYFIHHSEAGSQKAVRSAEDVAGTSVFMIGADAGFVAENKRTGQQAISDGNAAAVMVDLRENNAVQAGDVISVSFVDRDAPSGPAAYSFVVTPADIQAGFVVIGDVVSDGM